MSMRLLPALPEPFASASDGRPTRSRQSASTQGIFVRSQDSRQQYPELGTLYTDLAAQPVSESASDAGSRSSVALDGTPSNGHSRVVMWRPAWARTIAHWPPRNMDIDVEYDPEEVMSLMRQSVTKLRTPSDLLYQEVHNFFSIFLPRFVYDYGKFDDTFMLQMRRRFEASTSLKHGMLGTAVSFRSKYEQSELTPALRNHAKELHLLAVDAVRDELKDKRIPLWIKLAGLMVMSSKEYFAGNFAAYDHYLGQGALVIRNATGNRPIDLLRLSGAPVFDILWFAWCDIMSSMALSRPTFLDYESDVRNAPSISTTRLGQVNSDRNIEAVFSCPVVLTIVLARTSALRHARVSTEQKMSCGKEMELLVRDCQFRPLGGKQSTLRVARLGTQEIWRHTAILYIHQTIFKSNSSNRAVHDSVKAIIQIASTLTPGVNPDCFLPVPYFIAGFFAKSGRDRCTLRSRVLGCGNERLQYDLVAALDKLWAEMDTKGSWINWSKAGSPAFIF